MIQKGCHSVKIALLKVRWTVDSDMLARALIPLEYYIVSSF